MYQRGVWCTFKVAISKTSVRGFNQLKNAKALLSTTANFHGKFGLDPNNIDWTSDVIKEHGGDCIHKKYADVLNENLKLVPQLGWIGAANRADGIIMSQSKKGEPTPEVTDILLFEHHMKLCNRKLFDEKMEFDTYTHAEKITELCRRRLIMNDFLVEKIPVIYRKLLHPLNIPIGLSLYWELVDKIIYAANVRYYNNDWYIIRTALLTSYINSEVLMCNDTSANYSETKEFLIKSVKKNFKFGECQDNIVSGYGVFKNIARSLLSTSFKTPPSQRNIGNN